MSASNIDNAIRIAFGGNSGPGVMPVGVSDRIGSLPDEIRCEVESYIERALNIPLPNVSSLSEIGQIVQQQLSVDMPELSSESHAKLASYYTYNWK
ncbi:MAG: hypothetical protein AAF939_19140 [Planctomycetota bacterium]